MTPPATPHPPVRFEQVVKEFETKDSRLRAIDGLGFEVNDGERVAIVGETGSGKSTALSLLLGLTAPTAGRVSVLGNDPFEQFDALAGRVGIIFQSARLLDWCTARDNAAFGLKMLDRPKDQQRDVAAHWLTRLGLAGFLDAYPHELSGGMKQRVAIARTMAIAPDVLVADEAFSALDEITATSVRSDLLALLAEERTTTVFVTHSVTESVELADRVLVFGKPGRVRGVVDVAELRHGGLHDAHIADRVRDELGASRAGAPLGGGDVA